MADHDASLPSGMVAEPDIDALLQDAIDPALLDHSDTDENFSNEDVQRLTTAWTNEKQAPDLLPFADQLVGDLTEMVQNQAQMLDAIQEDNTAQAFTVMLYQSEIERIKYLLRSYLRTRLLKIEKHAMYYTSTEDYISRMSVNERNYAQRYRSLHEGHLRKSCLNKLPQAVQALDEMHGDIPMVPEPNLQSAVICRVVRDIGDFAVTESETVEMKKDNIFLVGYQAIRPLLAEGHVELL